MTKVAGIFDSRITADRAVDELLNANFTKDDISLLMLEQTRNTLFSSTDDEANRAAKGTVAGAVIGSVLGGLIVGLTAVGTIVTGGGALLASGPIVAVLSGVGAGGMAGGIAGGLIEAGFAADEANRFEEEIKRGKAVVVVHAADDRRANMARTAFRMAGATNIKAA